MGYVVSCKCWTRNLTGTIGFGVLEVERKLTGYHIETKEGTKKLEEARVYYYIKSDDGEAAFAKSKNYYAFFNAKYVKAIKKIFEIKELELPSPEYWLYDNNALLVVTSGGFVIMLAPIVGEDKDRTEIERVLERGVVGEVK